MFPLSAISGPALQFSNVAPAAMSAASLPGMFGGFGASGLDGAASWLTATSPAASLGDMSGLVQTPAVDMTNTGGGGFLGGASPVGAALGGLQTLGNLWMAFQANKLAKKQFKFTKDITNTNLANQIQSYNTSLADRARSRGVVEGQTPDQVAGYISSNALNRSSGKNGPTPVKDITSAALSNYSNYVRPEPTVN